MNNDDLLSPEDGGGCDPPALHGNLHLVPLDQPPHHRGHPVSVTSDNVIQIQLQILFLLVSRGPHEGL